MKLFIFGSTGDLVKRKVLPALHSIKGLEVYAIGRKEMQHKEYQEVYCPECENIFLKRLKYLQINFENIVDSVKPYLEKEIINYFYISLPPNMIRGILESLSMLKDYSIRILIEKPFGDNLAEAKYLADFIRNRGLENNIFLADHYVFKKNVLDLDKFDYKIVKIVSFEKVGLEKRGYYDSVGALRDMVQSHFLNILFRLVPDIDLSNFEILDFKKSQYAEYVSELGNESKTETYVKLRVLFGNLEVEFITGKGFDKKEGYIEVDGRKVSFGDEQFALKNKKEILNNSEMQIASKDNSYVKMIELFVKGEKGFFPSVEQAIKSWEFIEKIEENKPELDYYKKESKFDDFI